MKKFVVNLLCAFIPTKKARHKIRAKFFPRKTQTLLSNEWLGEHSYFGDHFVRMHKESKIGKFTSIGHNVSVGPSQHPLSWLSTSPFQYVKSHALTKEQKLISYTIQPTFVGNDVWIGNNVSIKDGVHISDGAVIGSNAVVTKDVPPYAIVAGVPAKVIRYRFPDNIIKQLMELQWWNLPDEEIATLPFDNIEKSIKSLRKIRKRLPLK